MRSGVFVDLFCGAGGTSSGLLAACADLGIEPDLLAINHDPTAIATHSLNHPGVRHLCEDLDSVNPRREIPGNHIDLLVASPECIGHSLAKGGQPRSEQSRATAHHVTRWAESRYTRAILVENVKEFRRWGPLGADGKPIKRDEGKLFVAWLEMLNCMGYEVDWRVLRCCDYGDATSRERLFIQCRRDGKVTWPTPSHVKSDDLSLYPGARPWRTARQIIDWSITGSSVFGRKRPLSPNTMRRIWAGMRRYSGLPFVLPHQHGSSSPENVRLVDLPLSTITGTSSDMFLVQPFLVKYYTGSDAVSIDAPTPAITANYEHLGLCQPFLIGAGGPSGQGKPQSVDEPLGTIMTENHRALCEPCLISYHGGPGSDDRSTSVNDPVPTIDTSNRFGLAQPFLVNYNGQGTAHSVDEPLDTVTGVDRFGLVEPQLLPAVVDENGKVVGRLDIRFRMLQPHELAAAHSFSSDYRFAGTKDKVVKQIGNSVPVRMARALCGAILGAAA